MALPRASLHYLDAQELKIETGDSLTMADEEQYRFGYVKQGGVGIHLYVNQQETSALLESGTLFLLPAESRCTIYNRATQKAHVVLVRFQWTGEEPLRSSPAGQSGLNIHHLRLPQAHNWMEAFLKGNRADLSAHFQLQSHLYALAAALMEHIHHQANGPDLFDYVEQTSQYMREHYEEPLNIEHIAQLSGASPSRFYRAFKQYTGLSPNKYVTYIRLNASLRLLASSNVTVAEVAHEVGYQDEYYFSRLFKKHMGLSPTEYAARAQKRIANLSPVFHDDLTVLGINPLISLQRGWSKQPDRYLEQIRNARPDLIFTSPVQEDIYQRLTEIAPVILLYWKRYSWKERLRKISNALGLSTVAKWWLDHFELKVRNAQAHIRKFLGQEPFLLVSVEEDYFRVFGTQHKRIQQLFYDELQITPPAFVHHFSALNVSSLAELAALGCDNVFFLVPASVADTYCSELHRKWQGLKGHLVRNTCFIIRYEGRLKYNAGIIDRLVDHTVVRLQKYSQDLQKNPSLGYTISAL